MAGLEALKEIGTTLMFINKNTLESKPLKEVMPNYYNIIEKSLKALEIIKKTKNIKVSFYENGSGKHYKIEFDKTRNQTITEEEFNLLKGILNEEEVVE